MYKKNIFIWDYLYNIFVGNRCLQKLFSILDRQTDTQKGHTYEGGVNLKNLISFICTCSNIMGNYKGMTLFTQKKWIL